MVLRHVMCNLPRPTNAVALTFDDGPDPEFTPRVLDELERLDVRGTFFLVGRRAAARPGIVRRIVAAGHAIGSHSFNHPEPGERGWRVIADFVRGRRAVEQAAGRRTPLFRAPKGYVARREHWAMAAARVQPWAWTIDTEDWQPGICSERIVANAASLAGGDVVLLHDGICGPLTPEVTNRSATVHAIEGIVAMTRSRGHELVTLPEVA
jgi:peptidoglycan/xylan/chitin deacetylase (PgdA/CDA1 family)